MEPPSRDQSLPSIELEEASKKGYHRDYIPDGIVRGYFHGQRCRHS